MPKTPYCQHCIEEFDTLVFYKGHWVCEACREELRRTHPKRERMHPEWEHTDKTLQVRLLQPGEELPEARTCFNFGTKSRGVETGAFTLHAGLLWMGWER
jgi:hypothetical protein